MSGSMARGFQVSLAGWSQRRVAFAFLRSSSFALGGPYSTGLAS